MDTRILLIALVFSWLASLCNAEGNNITQQSLDGEQSFKRVAEEVRVLPGFSIDTTLLHKQIENGGFFMESGSSDDIPRISDTSCIVIRIDAKMLDPEEYYLSLFGEVRNKRISNLYIYEIGTPPPRYFGLTETVFSIKCRADSRRVELTAVMKAMNFKTSGSIRFSYGGPHGTYDYSIDRYMIVNSEFTIPDEYIKYFECF